MANILRFHLYQHFYLLPHHREAEKTETRTNSISYSIFSQVVGTVCLVCHLLQIELSLNRPIFQ